MSTLAIEAPAASVNAAPSPMLAVVDLHVAYGQSEALHGLTFSVGPRESVAIMGRNGMGKTTLFKSLMGVIPTRSGRVAVDGREITHDESHRRVAKGIAYVPQGRMIFPTLTVEENIQTGLENAKHRDIPQDIYALFPVLWDMRRRKGGNLSGGQQQQLAIARALVTEPKVLLLDEPTEGIQPSIIKDIERVIRALSQRGDMAILLVEQYFDFARELADQFVILRRGEIVKRGVREEMDADALRSFLIV
jgi:urea transport system ATP-binding protein